MDYTELLKQKLVGVEGALERIPDNAWLFTYGYGEPVGPALAPDGAQRQAARHHLRLFPERAALSLLHATRRSRRGGLGEHFLRPLLP